MYPCENEFVNYKLDDAPVEHGVSAGEYKPGKKAYIGMIDFFRTFEPGRIQLSPPGIVYNGIDHLAAFSNDVNLIYYLKKNKNHRYDFVKSEYGDEVPFAVDIGKESIGTSVYFIRIVNNCTVHLGLAPIAAGVAIYLDGKNQVKITNTNYEVLTCKSRVCYETSIPMPKLRIPGPTYDTGCINNWLPYNNDDGPHKNGISAGLFDCDNEAFIGKHEGFFPGRIQTVGKKGFYTVGLRSYAYRENGSYYLADNSNYTYYWKKFRGKEPENAVQVRPNVGAHTFPIARAKVDGHVRIGYFVRPSNNAYFPSFDGTANEYLNDFEFLVCDPIPKYPCEQEWKKYTGDNAPTVDGFPVAFYNTDTGSFIGRGTRKCVNDCDYGLGRVQVTSPAGAYYIDYSTNSEIYDNVTAEYLVKNSSYTYQWVPSNDGEKVRNALEIRKEGHSAFYIGITKFNFNVVIGKVLPGKGLYFADINGNLEVTNSYHVLTCTSPYPSIRYDDDKPSHHFDEEALKNWYSPFSCPKRRKWSFVHQKCVCDPEWRDLFNSPNVKWNEETCSYVSA